MSDIPDVPQGSAETFTNEEIQQRIEDAIARSAAQLQRMHMEELARMKQELQFQHSAEMDSLRKSLAGGFPQSQVPANAGGVGTNIHETWSQYDQMLAAKGEHPMQQTA